MEIKKIPLSEIVPSPLNPRKQTSEDTIAELAESIKAQGLLQPITVRPIEQSGAAHVFQVADWSIKYEIVCGERRYKAWRLLYSRNPQFPNAIPATVVDLDDDAALDAMITENLQREDITPIDEAQAFISLAKRGKTHKEIAARFGKSLSFVRDRMMLTDLIPDLAKWVESGKMDITAAMAIAKAEPKIQQSFADQYIHAREISRSLAVGFLTREFHALTSAPWADRPDYTGGCRRECAGCPYNTAIQECLFYDSQSKNAQCVSDAGYNSKALAWLLEWLGQYREELVKAGEPITKGKTIVLDPVDECYLEGDKARCAEITRAVNAAGYATTSADAFAGKTWATDDDIIEQGLKDGTIYRCVRPCKYYSHIAPEFAYYRVKAEQAESGTVAPARPAEVEKLLSKRQQVIDATPVKLAKAANALLADINPEGDTRPQEVALLLYFAIVSAPYSTRQDLTRGKTAAAVLESVYGDREFRSRAIRAILKASAANEETIAEELCQLWAPDQRDEQKQQIGNAKAAALLKIDTKLRDLGYDSEGEPIQYVEPAKPYKE
ncbi:MAG: ParB/RepB/Spo0J family partition protein [Bacteroidales bacterium]|nr:ParB/RepB/Spo0J family partition protein [Bacteroidales bacterium]